MDNHDITTETKTVCVRLETGELLITETNLLVDTQGFMMLSNPFLIAQVKNGDVIARPWNNFSQAGTFIVSVSKIHYISDVSPTYRAMYGTSLIHSIFARFLDEISSRIEFGLFNYSSIENVCLEAESAAKFIADRYDLPFDSQDMRSSIYEHVLNETKSTSEARQ